MIIRKNDNRRKYRLKNDYAMPIIDVPNKEGDRLWLLNHQE